MRMLVLLVLGIMPLPAFGQTIIRKTTTVEEYAPISLSVAASPVVTYKPAPVYSAPVYAVPAPVMYAVPVHGKAPVGEYRTGLFGLRRNVMNSDGSIIQYGPLGRKR